MLGDSGRSYVVGYGKNPPNMPFHKWCTFRLPGSAFLVTSAEKILHPELLPAGKYWAVQSHFPLLHNSSPQADSALTMRVCAGLTMHTSTTRREASRMTFSTTTSTTRRRYSCPSPSLQRALCHDLLIRIRFGTIRDASSSSSASVQCVQPHCFLENSRLHPSSSGEPSRT